MNTQSQNDLVNTLNEIVTMNREKSFLVVMYELSADQYDAINDLLEVTDEDDGQRRAYFHHCLVVKTDEISQEELAAINAAPGYHKGVRYFGIEMSFID